MSKKVLAMSKKNEIYRLLELGFTERAIARTINCSRNTVKKYIEDDSGIQNGHGVVDNYPEWSLQINWSSIIDEVRKGTPIQVLWEELVESKKIVIGYNGFWKHFRKRFPELPVTMHRVFAPGSRTEIDYCDGIDIYDPLTGEAKKTYLFVGVLCHSRYVFAEFTYTQSSMDFLSSHVRMFEYFGGVTQVLSPDNLKSAIVKTHRYDPVVNPAYTRLAAHYGFAVVPARVRTPKDKAIVERTIQIFQRWFYFRVRHRVFTSLTELNRCLQEYLVLFHQKKHRIFRRTRLEMFEFEKSHLVSLPEHQFKVAMYTTAKLHEDCHLMFEKNFYSAPYELRGKVLDVWVTDKAVDIYHNQVRIAFHSKIKGNGLFATKKDHYPPAHQAYAEVTPTYLRELAEQIGPETLKLICKLMDGEYPLRYLRRTQGILAFAKRYGRQTLERACLTANEYNQLNYKFIERLIKNGRSGIIPISRPIQRDSNPLLRGEELFH